MFEKNTERTVTIIGQGVKLEGDFVGNGNVEFYGELKGTINISGFIKVGPNAQITANINAERAEIAGHVKGKITVTSDADLLATARVQGDVKAQQITIAKGAHISGKVTTETVPQRGVGKQRSAEPDDRKEK